MGIISVAPVVGGTLILASKYNSDLAAILAGINGNIDRNNLKTQWVRHSIQRKFYSLTAADTAWSMDIVLPTTADYTNVRLVGVGYTRGKVHSFTATGNARSLKVQRFAVATGVTFDTLETITIPAGTFRNFIDTTVAAIVPATYGIRLLFEASAGTFEADEWCDVDVWIATQVAAVTEL